MLPAENTEWPPYVEIGSWWDKLDEWEAWFSGDTEMIGGFYQTRDYSHHRQRFWAGVEREKTRALHLPAAGDVAAVSASLLFSEAPEIEYVDAGEGADRLNDVIIPGNILEAKLLEAAEMASALSGVYLKIDTDPAIADYPLIVTVKPANVVPLFRRGRLWEATFWRIVKEDDSALWYLFEERTNPTGELLVIKYRLYKGTAGQIGKEMPLNTIPETEAEGLDDITLPMKGIGVVYVPNNLPNKLKPGNPQGVSDYASCTTLMDALDEAWTSWMRDVRLGLGRILADKEFFTDTDTGEFDAFAEVFLKMDLGSLRLGSRSDKYEPLKEIQFELRTEQHKTTCTQLFAEIVNRSGYAPQSFGMEVQGSAESGTALRVRERKSLMTRGKKARYWRFAIRELLMQVQAYDVAANVAPTRYEPVDMAVQLQDSVQTDLSEISQTILNLRNAETLSKEAAIKLAHADWDEEQIAEELAALEAEREANMPEPINPTFGGEEEEA